jgi:hypothetical protein
MILIERSTAIGWQATASRMARVEWCQPSGRREPCVDSLMRAVSIGTASRRSHGGGWWPARPRYRSLHTRRQMMVGRYIRPAS